MEFVVDANVLFAALIRDNHTRHILLASTWRFYVPEFVFSEVYKYLDVLAEKTQRSTQEVRELLEELLLVAEITVVPAPEFSECLERAEQVSPDIDDAPYLALAMALNCDIWSNDKELKQQDAVQIYATHELPPAE